jgi:hypothetical protein
MRIIGVASTVLTLVLTFSFGQPGAIVALSPALPDALKAEFRTWVGQMGGHGNFSDTRIGLTITQTPDLVTSKLPALLDYQLSLRTPDPPRGSFDKEAATRGSQVFRNEGGCATCHQSPNFTDVLSGRNRTVPFLHDPAPECC